MTGQVVFAIWHAMHAVGIAFCPSERSVRPLVDLGSVFGQKHDESRV